MLAQHAKRGGLSRGGRRHRVNGRSKVELVLARGPPSTPASCSGGSVACPGAGGHSDLPDTVGHRHRGWRPPPSRRWRQGAHGRAPASACAAWAGQPVWTSPPGSAHPGQFGRVCSCCRAPASQCRTRRASSSMSGRSKCAKARARGISGRLDPYHGYKLRFEIVFTRGRFDRPGVEFDMGSGSYARDIARAQFGFKRRRDHARQRPGSSAAGWTTPS